MAFSSEIVDEIRNRISISGLISEIVQLKRSGRGSVGLCPFHAEKTPSFHVNEEQAFFHCFGCGKSGSIFDFVMETKGLSFPEAVKFLAARAGVQIEETPPSQEEQAIVERRKVLRSLMREVVELYQRELLEQAGSARDYLNKRGMKIETTRLYGLGFAPDHEFLLPHLMKSFEVQEAKSDDEKRTRLISYLTELGLLTAREDGSLYEPFRGRLIFPILRSDGVPIACGGRILVDAPNRPKYINSKESPLYLKRRTLYGLYQASTYLRRSRSAYVVEGYMDVMAMAQSGFSEVVATCGTAVTEEHAQVIRRFADRVTVIFDADDAGKKAATSCFRVFLNSGLDIGAVFLPDGEDPGSLLVRKEGAAFLEEKLKNERVPIVDVFLQHRLASDGSSPAVVGRVAEEVMGIVAGVSNPVEREYLTRRISEKLGVSVDSLSKLARGIKPQHRPSPPAHASAVDQPQRQSESARSNQNTGLRSQKVKFRASNPRNEQMGQDPGEVKLSSYMKQFLVAIAAEPTLSSSLSSMSSVMESLRQTEPNFGKVLSLVRDLQETSFPGLKSFRESGLGFDARNDNPKVREHLHKLRELFSSHGFAGARIVDEAWRQVFVGGANPRGVVSAVNELSENISLVSQMETLRTKLADESNELEKARLIQERIEKKRKLRDISARR